MSAGLAGSQPGTSSGQPWLTLLGFAPMFLAMETHWHVRKDAFPIQIGSLTSRYVFLLRAVAGNN